jgi:nicotinate-nucleotide adenylyltransferase
MANIGIFGGTFNPIHKGHLKIAKIAAKRFNLKKVFFIVAKIPPHKSEENLISPLERLAMVKLAIKNIQNFQVDDFEIRRNRTSYSYFTLRHYRKLFPNDKLYFIMGEDEFKTIKKWYKSEKIIKLCSFIVFNRHTKSIASSFLKKSLPITYWIRIKPINISSTTIRNFLWRKSYVWIYLPRLVQKYIRKKLLYL